jgi:Family of unknown function (DUF6361)
MPSTLAWLDHSDHHRRKAMEIIQLLQESGTVDELGLGRVRDAFAEILFPGITVLQTRARYFLFVPWVYQALEHRRIGSADVRERARRDELALIPVLTRSADPRGTMGRVAGQSLKLLPSFAYWQGLGCWGIRRYRGSQEPYHRSLDAFYAAKAQAIRTDDGEPLQEGPGPNWDPGLPPPPANWSKEAEFALQEREAEYLQERILLHAPGTMLAFLVQHGTSSEQTEFPWEHPQVPALPTAVAERLAHARAFSELVRGAPLLYNLMLAEKARRDELARDYRTRLGEWLALLAQRRPELERLSWARFWHLVHESGARVSVPIRVFIDQWIALTLRARGVADIDTPTARTLIHDRERLLKRGLARLDNARALELWEGEAGTRPINYRWLVVQDIVADILAGLGR